MPNLTAKPCPADAIEQYSLFMLHKFSVAFTLRRTKCKKIQGGIGVGLEWDWSGIGIRRQFNSQNFGLFELMRIGRFCSVNATSHSYH